MGNNRRITEDDDIKAVKRADRENEIQRHGKLISTRPTRTHSSKKEYRRHRLKKVDMEDL